MEKRFLVIGSDEKMKACAGRLSERGFSAGFCTEADIGANIRSFSDIVLPLPTVINGCVCGMPLDDFCAMLGEKHTVFCGNCPPDIFKSRAVSYYSNEDFLIKNSRLTAQGTLRLVLENIKTDLFSVSAAVIGYGHCGREICRSLKNNGAAVTSFSRRVQSLSAAENDGMKAESIKNINGNLKCFDIIINTVPCHLIDEKTLEQLTQDNIYIEIASEPFGFNAVQADKYKFRYVPAGGLPGRFFPLSAGINIADTVADIAETADFFNGCNKGGKKP